jgi:hypothetical protein
MPTPERPVMLLFHTSHDNETMLTALCCVTFKMLCCLVFVHVPYAGAPPFNADTPQEIFERALDGRIEFVLDEDGQHAASPECRDLIARLLTVRAHTPYYCQCEWEGAGRFLLCCALAGHASSPSHSNSRYMAPWVTRLMQRRAGGPWSAIGTPWR